MAQENYKFIPTCSRRNFLLFLIVGSFCVLSFLVSAPAVHAEQTVESIRLDRNTLQRGYTVTNGDLQVGIGAQLFEAEESFVKIKTLDEGDFPGAPEGMTLVSEPYVYMITMPESQYLDKPVFLGVDVATTNNFAKKMYFYNRRTGVWHPLPSGYDAVRKRMYAPIYFPVALVAVFETDGVAEGPALRAGAEWSAFDARLAVAVDAKTGSVIYGKNENDVWPIASLTKLVTAMVLLDQGLDFDAEVVYDGSCDRNGARLRVSPGETMSVRDLWYTMLAGSGNNATVCLVRAVGKTEAEFAALMNEKVASLGFKQTHFEDVTGLSPDNVSTPYEYAMVAQLALRKFDILSGTTTKWYSFTTRNFGIPHTIKNTNMPVLTSELVVTGAKTGYIDESLYNQMIKVKQPDNGEEVIVVILGNAGWQDRYDETLILAREAFQNSVWP